MSELSFDGYAAEWTRRHGGELRYGTSVRRGWLRVVVRLLVAAHLHP